MSKRYDAAAATFFDLMGELPIDNPFDWWEVKDRRFWQQDFENVLDKVRAGQLSKSHLRDYLPNFGEPEGGDWHGAFNYPNR